MLDVSRPYESLHTLTTRPPPPRPPRACKTDAGARRTWRSFRIGLHPHFERVDRVNGSLTYRPSECTRDNVVERFLRASSA